MMFDQRTKMTAMAMIRAQMTGVPKRFPPELIGTIYPLCSPPDSCTRRSITLVAYPLSMVHTSPSRWAARSLMSSIVGSGVRGRRRAGSAGMGVLNGNTNRAVPAWHQDALPERSDPRHGSHQPSCLLGCKSGDQLWTLSSDRQSPAIAPTSKVGAS